MGRFRRCRLSLSPVRAVTRPCSMRTLRRAGSAEIAARPWPGRGERRKTLDSAGNTSMNKLLCPIAFGILLAGLFARGAHGQEDFGGVPVARPFQQGVGLPVPARVWIGGNAVDNGVGYQGSYFTGGML